MHQPSVIYTRIDYLFTGVLCPPVREVWNELEQLRTTRFCSELVNHCQAIAF